MKKVKFEESWPESWKLSYNYDLVEIWGEGKRSGYCYAYINRFNNILGLIRRYVKPGGNILDVAAAQGNYSLALAELGYSVTWNDIREELVDYVKLKYEYGNINFKPGDIFFTDFNTLFDCIIVSEMIEHMAHPDRVLKRVSYFLNKGGFIILTTPNGAYFRFNSPKFTDFSDTSSFENIQYKPNADGHIFLLHLDEIHEFAKMANLLVKEVLIINNPFTNGHSKLGVFLKVAPRGVVNGIEKISEKLPLVMQKKINSCFIVLLAENKEILI